MSFRFKSVLQKGADTLQRSSLSNLRNTITTTTTTEVYRTNSYMDTDFYEGENYKSAIQCLNEGYNVYNDLLEYMRDYYELLKDFSASLVSFDKKWKTKLKEQSALSSYHTTKRAQRETIGTGAQLASIIDARCAAVEEVIKELRKEVNRYYASRGVGKTPKHNRADTLKDEFKSARSPVKNLEEKLEQLENKETKAKDAVRQAAIACENIQYGAPTSESKSDRAKKKHDEKQRELDSIKKQIDQTQLELQKAKLVYREQANVIFEKCQFIERKRLELIRSTLIKFIETIHSDDSLDKVDEIYADTLSKITKEQNTATDLQFWAETYGIHLTSALPIVNETSATTITASPEAAEVQPASESTISKPKVKSTKNSAEPTTPTPTPTSTT